jgi:hypothetical protein
MGGGEIHSRWNGYSQQINRIKQMFITDYQPQGQIRLNHNNQL